MNAVIPILLINKQSSLSVNIFMLRCRGESVARVLVVMEASQNPDILNRYIQGHKVRRDTMIIFSM